MVRDGSLRSTKLSTLALKGWNTWIIAPLKINMEPKNHPSEKKENFLPNLLVYHFLGSVLIFQGVVFRRCSLPNVNGRISLLAVDSNQQCPERDLGSSLNDYIAGWQQCALDYDICFYPSRRDASWASYLYVTDEFADCNISWQLCKSAISRLLRFNRSTEACDLLRPPRAAIEKYATYQ